jgi:hypothetical protein
MKAFVNALLLCQLLAGIAAAADLYRINVTSPADAERFNQLKLEPVARLLDGYLVLAPAEAAAQLTKESGAKFLAGEISREELAFDMRHDRENVGRHHLLFEEGSMRMFRVPAGLFSSARSQLDLAPARIMPSKLVYVASRSVNQPAIAAGVDLDSLIALVSQDSLTAYTNRLQAFQERVTGTDSNFAAQQWTHAKLQSFGYDSVVYDTFTAAIYGVPEVLRNVVAYKIGTRFPNRYIVVGGHLDGLSASPGADDNASGTAGTLEMARILADVETYLTFVFIAFDGEEQGLHGSYHYADSAGARGDTIEYMLNMDMIAHYENSNQANLFSGPDLTYTTLWQQLADSLVGITGVFAGVANNSDHAGFVDNGYRATFAHEYVFSTVYHSSRDSTTYMNFPYMTKMVKASLATAYAAMLDASAPSFEYVYNPGIPTFIYAGNDTLIEMSLVSRNNAVLVPGSGKLNFAINSGAYQQTPLTELLPNGYEFTLPVVDCGDTLRFYITIEEATSGLLSDGSASSPYQTMTITSLASSFADNFQTDKGWATEILGATAGGWQRGVPVNDPTWQYTPATDADGSGSCFLTQNTAGNSDVDNGAVRLTSPVFNLLPNGLISYDYFVTLNNSTGAVDRLLVEVNNGQSGNWYQVALYTADTFRQWRRSTVSSQQITSLGLPITAAMRIRFTANDANPQSVVEAGIDRFDVITYDCVSIPAYVCGDANGDHFADISDVVYLIAYIFSGGLPPSPLAAGDANCDSIVDISDVVYLIAYIFSGGQAPCAGCQ